ncbi:MAG: amino acid ABC transporter permease [Actinomycetes bacterium]|jgi:polar amino acid transport system permease protein|nr:amino acid ABC transporter permease [Actinomycetes bacterium]
MPSSFSDETQLSNIERERRRYRRRQTQGSVLVSLASTLVFAGLVALVLSRSPGWERVRQTFFSSHYFGLSFLPVLRGIANNVKILAFATVGVAILGTLIAAIRTTRSAVLFPLRALAAVYTDFMRGVPIMVLLFIVGFGVPGLGLTKGRISEILLGTIVITMAYSAYVAEVLRAGIQSVHPSQRAAARSLGLSYNQTLRLVILPQAIRRVIPPLMNDFVSMQKDVGLVSVLGVVDAVRAAQIETAHSFNFTSYVVAALLFVALSWPFIWLTDAYARRRRQREESAGVV